MSISSFILLAIVTQCHALVTSMSRGVYQPNQTIIFDERTFKNPRLLYALCDSSNKCRLEHDRAAFERPTDTCQVNLRDDKVIEKIRVLSIGKDKAIIVWIENDNDTFFGLAGVRFNDCSLHLLKNSFDYDANLDFIFQPIIVSYEDHYEVLFVNSKLCGDNYCKIIVDFKTHEVHGPTTWIKVDRDHLIADVEPIGTTSDQLLVIQLSGQISIVKGNDRTVLKNRESQTNSSSATLCYSTSNHFIGICEKINNTLSCSQFDRSSKRTFESAFPIDSTFNPRATYNLFDGGMLILLVQQNKEIRRVLKLDAHGLQAGRLDLRMRCSNPNNPPAQFFEKAGRYCVSLACFDHANKNHLEVVARCFDLSDIRAAWL